MSVGCNTFLLPHAAIAGEHLHSPTIGGAARWVFDRFDRHQKAYLEELAKRDEREEERRKQHLEDTRFYATQLRDLAHQLRADVDSRRPPPERKP